MANTTFEIIFVEHEINGADYPEATKVNKTSIIVEATERHVIPKGLNEVSLFIKGELKQYSGVFAVCALPAYL